MLGTLPTARTACASPPRLRTGRERLVHVDRVDPAGANGVLREREAHFHKLDVLVGIDAVPAQHQIEWAMRPAADDADADRLALEVRHRLDRAVILDGPIDREAARPLADMLGDDIDGERAVGGALADREHALRGAIDRAGGERLRHHRGALELRPLDLVGLAEARKFLRPTHHPVFRFLGRNGPADLDGAEVLRARRRHPIAGCQRQHRKNTTHRSFLSTKTARLSQLPAGDGGRARAPLPWNDGWRQIARWRCRS